MDSRTFLREWKRLRRSAEQIGREAAGLRRNLAQVVGPSGRWHESEPKRRHLLQLQVERFFQRAHQLFGRVVELYKATPQPMIPGVAAVVQKTLEATVPTKETLGHAEVARVAAMAGDSYSPSLDVTSVNRLLGELGVEKTDAVAREELAVTLDRDLGQAPHPFFQREDAQRPPPYHERLRAEVLNRAARQRRSYGRSDPPPEGAAPERELAAWDHDKLEMDHWAARDKRKGSWLRRQSQSLEASGGEREFTQHAPGEFLALVLAAASSEADRRYLVLISEGTTKDGARRATGLSRWASDQLEERIRTRMGRSPAQ